LLNLVWVNTFLTLAQVCNFQKAASQLGIAQPTVTQHIQKLEEKLGVTLFERTRYGCKATQPALIFLPYARSLIRINNQALVNLNKHQLRVGASSNIGIYLLPSIMRRYIEEGSPAGFDLTIESNPSIARKLDDGEIDVALMEWWDDRQGFDSFCWKEEPVVLIVHPSHPFASRASVTRKEVGQLELLGGEPGTGTGRLLQQFFANNGSMPKVVRSLGSTEAVKQNVKAGMGMSLVMWSSVQEEVAFGSLSAIPMAEPALMKPVFLVIREGQPEHSLPRIFAEFIRHSGASSASSEQSP